MADLRFLSELCLFSHYNDKSQTKVRNLLMLISVCLSEFRVCHAIDMLQKNKLETAQWKKPRKRNVIKD